MTKQERIIIIVLSIIYSIVILIELFFYLKLIKRPKIKFKKILYYNFLIILLIVFSLLTLSYTNYLDYEKPIPYSKFHTISFRNFRGLEFFKRTFLGNEHYAYVVTSIEYQIEKDFITVEAYFHPSKSFVYNKDTNSNDLLTHELYHFKITEIYARMTREKISKLNNPSKENITNIIRDCELLENEFQKKYDYETYHSYIYNKQIKYQKIIDSTLLSLNKFKDPKIPTYENN